MLDFLGHTGLDVDGFWTNKQYIQAMVGGDNKASVAQLPRRGDENSGYAGISYTLMRSAI